ncbi:MAG: hypothetical protein RIN63_12925 [Tissierella sp.]|nr:hypothetical protein [Tissierella sp.]MDR7857483.1 hypothetical protein [Tissierella sp.]
MNTNKRILIFFSLIIMLGLGISHYIPREQQIENTDLGLRIGSGADITGLLLQRIIETNESMDIKNINAVDEEEKLFDFTFKDC